MSRLHWLMALAAVLLVNCLLVPSRAIGQLPGDGRLVDVGGYRLHITCAGVGSPTVVLEAGLGGSSNGWVKVMPEVATFTRVCAYDRPNEGASDAAPRRIIQAGAGPFIALRNGHDVINDLHTLLFKAGEVGPYVLVGHSLGGLYSILYANAYPKEVVGMVLEDSVHPDQLIMRAKIGGPVFARREHESLMQNEEGADIDAILAEGKAIHWHTGMPLYVLCAAPGTFPTNNTDGLTEEQWDRLQKVHREWEEDLARLSSDSKFVVAEKSGHFIHRDQPDIVIDAIRSVVGEARARPAESPR